MGKWEEWKEREREWGGGLLAGVGVTGKSEERVRSEWALEKLRGMRVAWRNYFRLQ